MALMTRCIPALAIGILLGILFQPASATAISGNIPLDSDLYRILDDLNARGFLVTYLAGTRPITWAEAHRLLEEARGAMTGREEKKLSVPSGARKALDALERAVYGRFTVKTKAGSGPLYALLDNPEVDLIFLEGEPSAIPGIRASQHALVYNNGGFDPDEGLTAVLAGEVEAQGGPFLLQAFPRITTGDQDREFLSRGTVRIGFLGLELSGGRESLWWGQGTHGGLYLTPNAEPLPMVRLTNPSPAILPWLLSYLGPFRLDLFLSRLEPDRAVPEPFLLGLRTNFRPFRALELAGTIMVMTGGEGRPDVDFGDLFDLLFGENEISGDRSNKIAGIDARLNLPGYQLYLEFGGEDEAGGWPSKNAGLVGLNVPLAGPSMDLRLEYADFAYTEEIANVWYRHGVYTDGYTYEGRLLGHHVGGDGRDLFAEMTFGVGERGRGRVGVDLEWRGVRLQPAVERHTQISAGWEGPFPVAGLDTTLGIDAAVDLVENHNYVNDKNGKGYFLSVTFATEM